MCGIAGFLGFTDDALLRRMCGSLTHRGPDESGYFSRPGVGLAMRRLAVIDLTTGCQPIANETQDVWVVFNGEIYNYQDLTAELKSRGHVFTTTSDTETIVHLYEEHGLDFVQHLRGMFAIALWDGPRRRLVLARDRIGEKPLYYSPTGSELIFGSEIKAILQRGGARSVNAQAVCDLLACGYVTAPHSFFAGIHKLAPAEMLVCEEGRFRKSSYWRRDPGARSDLSPRQAEDALAERLSDTVKLCLKSDVEVGAFLSGGVDSSVLVALMAQHSAAVQTFTVGYGGAAAGFNELQFARRMAEHIGTRHHELILQPHSTMELLPRVLWHFDEPHGEPTSVLVYLLCEFTRRGVKVAVGGTGGDEIFFGYPKHKGVRLMQHYRMLPRMVRKELVERVVMKWPESTSGSRFAKRAKRFMVGSDLPPDEAYLAWTSLLQPEVRSQILSPALAGQAADPTGEATLRAYLTGDDRRELLDRVCDLEVGAYLPEYQLAYMDRMSMAHGLEVRSPLCDYRLVEFVTSLPASYRLQGTRSKHLLKQVAQRWVPKLIAERPKVGFDSPIGQWIKGELREFVTGFLSRDHLEKSGLFQSAGVERVLADHLSGKRDYSLQLWSLLAVEAWHRMYLEDGITQIDGYGLNCLRGAQPPVTSARRANGSANRGAHAVTTSAPRPPTVRTRRRGWSRRRLWESTPRAWRGPIGKALGLLPPQALLGKRFRKWMGFIEKAQWWSAEQAAAYQLGQLRLIMELARERTPYYRRVFADAGFDLRDLKTADDLVHLPTIDRRVLLENLSDMCAVPPASRGVDYVSTGGTGGTPLYFYIGEERSAVEYAHLVAGWQRLGYRLDMPLAVLRGHIVPRSRTGLRHEYDPVLRHHYYSTFHLSEENMRAYLEHVRGIGSCFLHVYPSSVATLARFMENEGIGPVENVFGVIAESEMVYRPQRELVERVFARRYFSCYGHSEKLIAAAECEHSTDYHVWPTYGFFELLDERGRRVTTPGARGELVGTGFINRVVPFIRYRTGDFATFVADRCTACGRQHPIIRDIQGHRTQEMLVTAGGSMIPWTALNMHDHTFDRVQRFQFLQTVPGEATLRLVVSSGFDQSDERRILGNLAAKLDGQINLRLERCQDVQLSPVGKAIYVDQRMALPGDVATSAIRGEQPV